MASDSMCEPPCVNYSLNYDDENNIPVVDLPNYIYKQYDDCKEKNNCSTAPLLDENGQPFFTWFGQQPISSAAAEKAYLNSYEALKFTGKSADVPVWNSLIPGDPVNLMAAAAATADNFTYPLLKPSCEVKYNVGIDNNNNIINGETVCLMDYMNEYLKEYNKTLCINIKETKDSTGQPQAIPPRADTICRGYDNTTKHEKSNKRAQAVYGKTRYVQRYQGFQGNKEDQLKKDFVKMYNDNLFEIFTVSLAILVTAYLIKKY